MSRYAIRLRLLQGRTHCVQALIPPSSRHLLPDDANPVHKALLKSFVLDSATAVRNAIKTVVRVRRSSSCPWLIRLPDREVHVPLRHRREERRRRRHSRVVHRPPLRRDRREAWHRGGHPGDDGGAGPHRAPGASIASAQPYHADSDIAQRFVYASHPAQAATSEFWGMVDKTLKQQRDLDPVAMARCVWALYSAVVADRSAQ